MGDGIQSGSGQLSPNHRSPETANDNESTSASSASDDVDLSRILEDMLRSAGKRRDNKRKTIQQEHSKRTMMIRRDIESTYSDQQQILHKARRVRVKRLCELYKKKSYVESRMLSNSTKLESAICDLSLEIQAVIKGRHGNASKFEASDSL
ncbi:MAG: hypothetical protein M1833_003243 [Piccolia ochrophora]|nr:MAG: hypothetical protein M1833_003243 [Piccolia ochrophora]